MKILLVLACLLVPGAVFAAGGGGGGFSGSEPVPTLMEIRTKIDAKKYSEAIKLLKLFIKDDAGNADAWNYLGFSYRKSGKLPDAFKAYDKALALDPKHLGAHEYLGEAYLMNKQPDKARELLARLKKLCGDCEEYRDLERAIAAYDRKK